MKTEQTIAQFLNIKDFPLEIKDNKGYEIYFENSNGFWIKREYDDDGNIIYREESDGYWGKYEYDNKGYEIYFENSYGFWTKREYDDQSNEIYFEGSDGFIVDKRPKPIIELTLEDIAKLKGVDVGQIRIKE
jgi:hypothetical protein